VVGPQLCLSTFCLQQTRHDGALEHIYRHDSVTCPKDHSFSHFLSLSHRFMLARTIEFLAFGCWVLVCCAATQLALQLPPGSRNAHTFVCFVLFVCLFVVIKPPNPYFASRPGLEVKPLGVYPLMPRSSSCGPTTKVHHRLETLYVPTASELYTLQVDTVRSHTSYFKAPNKFSSVQSYLF